MAKSKPKPGTKAFGERSRRRKKKIALSVPASDKPGYKRQRWPGGEIIGTTKNPARLPYEGTKQERIARNISKLPKKKRDNLQGGGALPWKVDKSKSPVVKVTTPRRPSRARAAAEEGAKVKERIKTEEKMGVTRGAGIRKKKTKAKR